MANLHKLLKLIQGQTQKEKKSDFDESKHPRDEHGRFIAVDAHAAHAHASQPSDHNDDEGWDEQGPEHIHHDPRLKKSERPPLGDVAFAIQKQLLNQIEQHGQRLKTKAPPSVAGLYSSYKAGPHNPNASVLKYIIHRIENINSYRTPYEAQKADQAFLNSRDHAMTLSGLPSDKKQKQHSIEVLHNILAKNPHFIDDVIKHRDELHAHLGQFARNIDGVPHVALARGLSHGTRIKDPMLSSYADSHDDTLGGRVQKWHNHWVPLKNIWYSYDFGPSEAHPSKYFPPQNEYLVSPHELKDALSYNVKKMVRKKPIEAQERLSASLDSRLFEPKQHAGAKYAGATGVSALAKSMLDRLTKTDDNELYKMFPSEVAGYIKTSEPGSSPDWADRVRHWAKTIPGISKAQMGLLSKYMGRGPSEIARLLIQEDKMPSDDMLKIVSSSDIFNQNALDPKPWDNNLRGVAIASLRKKGVDLSSVLNEKISTLKFSAVAASLSNEELNKVFASKDLSEQEANALSSNSNIDGGHIVYFINKGYADAASIATKDYRGSHMPDIVSAAIKSPNSKIRSIAAKNALRVYDLDDIPDEFINAILKDPSPDVIDSAGFVLRELRGHKTSRVLDFIAKNINTIPHPLAVIKEFSYATRTFNSENMDSYINIVTSLKDDDFVDFFKRTSLTMGRASDGVAIALAHRIINLNDSSDYNNLHGEYRYEAEDILNTVGRRIRHNTPLIHEFLSRAQQGSKSSMHLVLASTSNSEMDSDTLRQIYNTARNLQIDAIQLLQNTHTPNDVVEDIFSYADPEKIRGSIPDMVGKMSDDAIIKYLLQSPSHAVRLTTARSIPNPSQRIIMEGIKDQDSELRMAWVTKPQVPAEALVALSKDRSIPIKRSVAAHNNLPPEVANKMLESNSHPDIASALLYRNDINPKSVHKFLKKTSSKFHSIKADSAIKKMAGVLWRAIDKLPEGDSAAEYIDAILSKAPISPRNVHFFIRQVNLNEGRITDAKKDLIRGMMRLESVRGIGIEPAISGLLRNKNLTDDVYDILLSGGYAALIAARTISEGGPSIERSERALLRSYNVLMNSAEVDNDADAEYALGHALIVAQHPSAPGELFDDFIQKAPDTFWDNLNSNKPFVASGRPLDRRQLDLALKKLGDKGPAILHQQPEMPIDVMVNAYNERLVDLRDLANSSDRIVNFLFSDKKFLDNDELELASYYLQDTSLSPSTINTIIKRASADKSMKIGANLVKKTNILNAMDDKLINNIWDTNQDSHNYIITKKDLSEDLLSKALKAYKGNANYRGIFNAASRNFSQINPDKYNENLDGGHDVNIHPAIEKLKHLKGLVVDAGGSMHKRDIPGGGNLPKELFDSQGRLTAAGIDSFVDKLPRTRYNVSYSQWSGLQTHSSDSQTVLQVNLTSSMIKELKEKGLFDIYRIVSNSSYTSAHPVDHHSIGWARIDDNHEGHWHIDEIQSDFSRQTINRISEYKSKHGDNPVAELGGMRPQQAIDAMKSVVSILSGGFKNINHAIFGAVHEVARSLGIKTTSMDTLKDQADQSGMGNDRQLPGHMINTYSQLPEGVGYKPGKKKDVMPTTDSNYEDIQLRKLVKSLNDLKYYIKMLG